MIHELLQDRLTAHAQSLRTWRRAAGSACRTLKFAFLRALVGKQFGVERDVFHIRRVIVDHAHFAREDLEPPYGRVIGAAEDPSPYAQENRARAARANSVARGFKRM
jgi:hypothetical protein